MPIYAFECSACAHTFERLQKLSDADPTDCPECGVAQVRRQLTAPQFRLSGGGWYETDFKKDGDKKRNLAGDSGAPKESGGSESKSDGKPAEPNSAGSGAAGTPSPSAPSPSGAPSSPPSGSGGSSGSSGASGSKPPSVASNPSSTKGGSSSTP